MAQLLQKYLPSGVPSLICSDRFKCVSEVFSLPPYYQKHFRVGISYGEDSITAERRHAALSAMVIQHVIHLTAIHVHVE